MDMTTRTIEKKGSREGRLIRAAWCARKLSRRFRLRFLIAVLLTLLPETLLLYPESIFTLPFYSQPSIFFRMMILTILLYRFITWSADTLCLYFTFYRFTARVACNYPGLKPLPTYAGTSMLGFLQYAVHALRGTPGLLLLAAVALGALGLGMQWLALELLLRIE